MTAFEKWLGRADLFIHQLRKDHPLTWNLLPIVNYDNDLRKAYEAGVRKGKRDVNRDL